MFSVLQGEEIYVPSILLRSARTLLSNQNLGSARARVTAFPQMALELAGKDHFPQRKFQLPVARFFDPYISFATPTIAQRHFPSREQLLHMRQALVYSGRARRNSARFQFQPDLIRHHLPV